MYDLGYDYIAACRVSWSYYARDIWAQGHLYVSLMLPGASTSIAQSMDNPLGLSLSPSLPILPPWAAPGHCAGICVIRRRWAAEKVVFTSGLTFQMLGG